MFFFAFSDAHLSSRLEVAPIVQFMVLSWLSPDNPSISGTDNTYVYVYQKKHMYNICIYIYTSTLQGVV